MNPDDLAAILDELGRRLGPVGTHVFELAVRQAVITGVMYAIGGAFLLALALIAVAVTYRMYVSARRRYDSKERGPYDYSSGPGMTEYAMVGGSVAGFAGVIGASLVLVALPYLLNPEYAALRDILGAIGGAR